MKSVIKILGLAVKYGSMIMVVVEILQFATDKLKPFADDSTSSTDKKE